jgi:Acetyltransferase (GNAT) family
VQSGDAAALAQLMCELGYETTKSDMQMRVARIATDERYRTFVAVRDGKVCGMIGTFAYYSFGHNNPCGRIVALVVRKDSRRLAFGGGWSWRWKKTLSDEASSASPWIHGLREKTRTRFMSARLRTKRVAICGNLQRPTDGPRCGKIAVSLRLRKVGNWNSKRTLR